MSMKSNAKNTVKNRANELFKIIQDNKGYLIHVTEFANLKSIIEEKIIFSRQVLKNKNWEPLYMTNDLSHNLDSYKNLDRYVHLAFAENYDMFQAKIYRNELKYPALLLIKPDVVFESEVMISDSNSSSSTANIGGVNEVIDSLDFNIIYNSTWFNSENNSYNKSKRQAEVLVKEGIELHNVLKIIIPRGRVIDFTTLIPIVEDDTKRILQPGNKCKNLLNEVEWKKQSKEPVKEPAKDVKKEPKKVPRRDDVDIPILTKAEYKAILYAKCETDYSDEIKPTKSINEIVDYGVVDSKPTIVNESQVNEPTDKKNICKDASNLNKLDKSITREKQFADEKLGMTAKLSRKTEDVLYNVADGFTKVLMYFFINIIVIIFVLIFLTSGKDPTSANQTVNPDIQNIKVMDKKEVRSIEGILTEIKEFESGILLYVMSQKKAEEIFISKNITGLQMNIPIGTSIKVSGEVINYKGKEQIHPKAESDIELILSDIEERDGLTSIAETNETIEKEIDLDDPVADEIGVEKTESLSRGNTVGNVVNMGLAAKADDWIYYANSWIDAKLFKIKTDGSQQTMLSDDWSNSINLIGDWIYYSNVSDEYKIYKIKTAGTQRMIISNDDSGIVSVAGDWIYYNCQSMGSKIYKIKTDGTQRTRINNDECYFLNVVGDWIYYSNSSDDAKLYKIKTDGTKRTKIYDDVVQSINVVGDWIYYSNGSDDNKLYKTKIDGTQRTKINDDYSLFNNVVGDWIYYTNLSDDCKLYKIKTDGSQRIKINDDRSGCINVVDDWIYYIDTTKGLYEVELYRIKTDGTQRMIVR